MPLELIYRCTLCGTIVKHAWDNHECTEDPATKAKREAESKAWLDKYNAQQEVWEEWELRTGELENAIASVDGLPDEVAVKGQCRFVATGDEKSVKTRVFTNPTWGQLMRAFDKTIPQTKDYHHCFLEGVELLGPSDQEEVSVYEFVTGS